MVNIVKSYSDQDSSGKLIANRYKPSIFGRRSKPGYSIQADVWIEKDGELYIGYGRVMLLEKLGMLGSIADAAREMRMTYRNAWLWIESMNRLAPSPLTEKGCTKKACCGDGTCHTRLTREGKRVIAEYHDLHAKLLEIFDKTNQLNEI